jgi:uncharacterized membrane protein YkvA (DUF1232 family)
MPLQISFELSDADLEHFKAMAISAAEAISETALDQDQIVTAARNVFEAADANKEMPEFISSRLSKLKGLVDMVSDSEWQLPEEDLKRVLNAMAYFANPDDIIHDSVPTLGFLDDAIMVELTVENLEPEISAYSEFCQFRQIESQRRINRGLSADISKEDWLAEKRAAMHSRMRARRQQSPLSHRGARISLW